MDAVEELIARFRPPSPNRLWLVDRLILALPDRRAIDALLTAAADRADEEDVRCAALKVFHTHTPKNRADRERLVTLALEVVRTDPSDLVRDAQMTPFNIGRRIELRDFTEVEAEPLALGLKRPATEASVLLNRILYWTDRGDPPRGNTVNRVRIDDTNAVPQILVTHLMEGIGIALDVPGNRMFVTDFAGSVYSADLDGKNERNFLYGQGNLTGIAYTEI